MMLVLQKSIEAEKERERESVFNVSLLVIIRNMNWLSGLTSAASLNGSCVS